MPLLSLQNITTHYGKIRALKGISFEIESGEIVCLIGANGAGKTTTLKTICGLLKPTRAIYSTRMRTSPAFRRIRSSRAGSRWYLKDARFFPR
jgi:ABC-type multidrug transport system ATPase subunit